MAHLGQDGDRSGHLPSCAAVIAMLLGTEKLGSGAAGILMDPDGSRAFVACSGDNYIVVIDLKKLEDVRHLDVGGIPDGMAWAIQP